MKNVYINKINDLPDYKNIIKYFLNEKDKYDDEPFYIVDLDKVKEQYNKWINYLPNIQPYFAVKSNPDKKIIKLLDVGV